MAPVRLSAAHLAAARRRRRIIDQMDACDVLMSGLDVEPSEWLEFVFSHADMPGSGIDTICWDVAVGEDSYALHPSKLVPAYDCPPLERWRAAGIDWLGALVDGCHERGLEAFWCSRFSEVDLPQPFGAGHTHPSVTNPLKQAHPDWLLRCWWWYGPHALHPLSGRSQRSPPSSWWWQAGSVEPRLAGVQSAQDRRPA